MIILRNIIMFLCGIGVVVYIFGQMMCPAIHNFFQRHMKLNHAVMLVLMGCIGWFGLTFTAALILAMAGI